MTLRCLLILTLFACTPQALQAQPAGAGGERDPADTVRQYRLAADKGDQDAAYALVKFYSADNPAHTDIKEMQRWLARGVQLDDPRAMVWLAHLLFNGTFAPYDQAEAVKLYMRAAEMGNVSALYYLALRLDEGSSMPQDLPRAAQLYRLVSEQIPAALERVVTMQFAGEGMPADPAAAMAVVDAELARGELVAMLDLAATLQWRGQPDAADAVRQRVLAHPDIAAARKRRDFVDAYGRLGEAYSGLLRLDVAQTLLAEHRALLDKLPDASPAAIAESMLAMGDLHFQRGETQLAETTLARSVTLFESGNPGDTALAQHLGAVAGRYDSADQFAQAEPLRRRALALVLAQSDTAPDVLARYRSRLAYNLHMQGKYEEAETLLAAAIAALEAFHHPGSASLLSPLDLMGKTYLALGRLDLAAAQYRRQLVIRERNSGEAEDRTRALTLSHLAALDLRARRHAEAERLLQQAFAMYKPRPDGLDIGLARLYHLHGELLRDTGRYAAADVAFERALAIMLAIPAAAKWDASGVMHDLGLSLRQQDQPERAAAMLARAFAIRLAVQPQHHLTRQTGDALAAVYRASGKPDAAADVEKRLRAPMPGLN